MAKKEILEHLKSECNFPKSDLLKIEKRLLEAGCVKEAERLGKIIQRLEAWQH